MRLDILKHVVVKNSVSVVAMQGLNYAIPLFTFPYIVRIVGLEAFGEIALTLAYLTYISMITEYGFSLTATRDIAVASENPTERSKIFSAVIAIKLMFLTLCSLIIAAASSFVVDLTNRVDLIIASIPVVLGNVLMPIWYYQGIQKTVFITAMQFLGQILYVSLLILLVHGPDDYLSVIYFQGFGLLLSAFLSIYFGVKFFGLSMIAPDFMYIKKYLKNGCDIFISRIFLNMYSTTNIIVLGLVTSPLIVGQYSIAEKLISFLMSIPNAVNQSLYPHIVNSYVSNRISGLAKEVRSAFFILIMIGIMLFICMYLFKGLIVHLVTGKLDGDVIDLVEILGFGLLISPLGALYTNTLVVIGEDRLVRNILIIGGLLSFVIIIPVVYAFGSVGLAIVSVLSGYGVVMSVRRSTLSRLVA